VDYIDSVRKQLVELKDMLELNKEAIRQRCSVLQDASVSLLALSEGPDNNRKVLYELPRILQSVLTNDSVGALILGSDGKVLLFNGAAQKIFGDRLLLDEVRKFDCGVNYADGVTSCPSDELPWIKALAGSESKGERLFLPSSKNHHGSWLSVDAVPLWGASKDQIGGAVVLVVDITEPLQVDSRVKSVLTTLSQHIMTIECAQSELKKLSEKLGLDGQSADDQESAYQIRNPGKVAANRIASSSPVNMLETKSVDTSAAQIFEEIENTFHQLEQIDLSIVQAVVSPTSLLEQQLEEQTELQQKPALVRESLKTADSLPKTSTELKVAATRSAVDANALLEDLASKQVGIVTKQVVPPTASNNLILIVDDLAVNQKLLQLDLESVGYDTHVASNGLEATEKVASNKYLLVFMDCDMPVMNGYEATAIIRATEANTKQRTPIVAMTAYDRHGDRERCYEIGMDYYITKGVGIQEILAVVELCQKGELKELKEIGTLEMNSLNYQMPSPGENQVAPIFSMETLVETYGKEEATEITSLFFSTSSSIVSMLESAIADHNSSAVNHLCYSLKGPSASMCLPQLVRLSVDIASYTALGRWTEARETFASLCGIYGELKDKYAPEQIQTELGADEQTPDDQKLVVPVPDEQLEPVIAKLQSIKAKLGKEGINKVLDAYQYDLQGIEEKIKDAIIRKDAEGLKSICHLLTGCFKSLQAKDAAKKCVEMGELGARDSWQQAIEKYKGLVAAIRTISETLEKFRQTEEPD
jgi:CheY-like chemotaxis protein